ncbi:hypothetical protein TNCV_3067691 [Trichonephila clavipes]|nr:hypothetical protein TNCV_3067691 [Trichonephila clavipes]
MWKTFSLWSFGTLTFPTVAPFTLANTALLPLQLSKPTPGEAGNPGKKLFRLNSVCTRRVFGDIEHRTQAFRSGVRCSNH